MGSARYREGEEVDFDLVQPGLTADLLCVDNISPSDSNSNKFYIPRDFRYLDKLARIAETV